MLNKAICKKCINQWAREEHKHPKVIESNSWSDDDYSNWRKGFVLCPFLEKSGNLITMKKEPPHENCVYRLEQTIINKSRRK